MNKPTYEVNLFLKSGNVITFHSTKLEYTTIGGNIQKMSWANVIDSPLPSLQTINPEQIEAITTRELTEKEQSFGAKRGPITSR